ncbi:DNA-binding Xre family transcriptional regulator [Pedobacter sp. UYEF25]
MAKIEKNTLTEFGIYLAKKSVNRSLVSQKTGISITRLARLSTQANSHLRVDELYLVALAIEVNPNDILEYLTKDLKLLDQ